MLTGSTAEHFEQFANLLVCSGQLSLLTSIGQEVVSAVYPLPSCRHLLLLLLVFRCSNSRSMTPITWQVAVDDEEQRPLPQDILEAADDDWRQAAVDVEEQRPQLQDIFEAAIDGNHV